MPIIGVQKMKTIDGRQKGSRWTEAIEKGCELNDFFVHLS